MTHYFCKGTCGHVSEAPGECGNPDCTEHGKKFNVCACTEENHRDILVGYKIEQIKEAVAYLKSVEGIEGRVGFSDLAEIEKYYEFPAKLSAFCPVIGDNAIDSTVCHSNVQVKGKAVTFFDLFADLRKLLTATQ